MIPEWIQPKEGSMVRFQVTGAMVDRFSELTGDQSALHVNETFARRSIYRQPVVHGMLPVAFLSLIDSLRIDGKVCRLISIEGQFSNPVYLGETLDLLVVPAKHQNSVGEIAFDYQIRKVHSKAAVTMGMFSVLYGSRPSAQSSPPAKKETVRGLLMNPPLPRDLSLEEISKGDSDGFEFVITDEATRSLMGILTDGVQAKDIAWQTPLSDAGYLQNLMAIVLFSTLIGMRLPGKSATFLEFSAKVEEEIQCGERYWLEGKVAHVSRATNIIKTGISIFREDGGERKTSITGKVATLVNRPSREMPSFKDLQTSAMDPALKEKVVLITGASRGIGETTAKLFALFGARVIVNYYRGKEDADRIVQEILEGGGTAIAVKGDVTQSDQVQKMVENGIERFGAIHILVNNAVRDFRPVSFANLSWDEIQKDLDVIVKGAFHCCKAVIPFMLRQGGGKIINISSIVVDDPPPDQLKYVVSKSALVGLTRSLSMEFASRNIHVNMVVPNFVETDLVSHVQESFRGKIAQAIPMNRLASPVEVAHAVLFLASAFSSYTTGQKLMVTGGKPPYL